MTAPCPKCERPCDIAYVRENMNREGWRLIWREFKCFACRLRWVETFRMEPMPWMPPMVTA